MAASSEIAWTDATFNPWWGCVKVSPACLHCYAEAADKRFGGDHWGKDAPRRFFGKKHWAEPLRWNEAAEKAGTPRRVFCGSMCDVFEFNPAEFPQPDGTYRTLSGERASLRELIEQTPWLIWQLLTKRPENMVWMSGRWVTGWPANVIAMTTVEDQERADERIPHLLRVPAQTIGLSMEPLLGPVTFPDDFLKRGRNAWVILGGESGPHSRKTEIEWFHGLVGQCADAGVPVFFKQTGERLAREMGLKDRKGGDVSELYGAFTQRQFPHTKEPANV